MNNRTVTSVRNAFVVFAIAALLAYGGWFVANQLPEGDGGEAPSTLTDRGLTSDDVPDRVPDRERTQREKAPRFGDAEDDFDIGRDRKREPLRADGDFESPFVAVAERLKPSVVNIYVEGKRGSDAIHPDMRMRGGGSGVIIDEKGYVLTNHHVVDNADKIVVTLSGGEERDATLIGADPETDLALIEIGDVHTDRVADLGDSEGIAIGDWAIAMGNPLGLDWTLTVGVISAKGRSDLRIAGGGPVFQDFIQTDASINFGNSGGALANIHGEVIGINSATNSAANGIGFAIPINMARRVAGQLLETGYVQRGYLGMVPTELDALKKEALGLDSTVSGVFVESVAPGTPAEDGGLRDGDVVVAIDGTPVETVADFRMRVADHAPGERMSLTVIRKGEIDNLDFTLADRAEFVASASEGRRLGNGGTWLGLEVASLESAEAREFTPETTTGVVVVAVATDSPADGKLQPGDVIVQIADYEVATIDDWKHLTDTIGDPTRALLIKYHPLGRGATRFVAVKP